MKKSISCVFVVIIALLYSSVLSMPNIVNSYAQNNTGLEETTTPTPTQLPTTLTPGVKITTPGSNQQVSVGNNNKTIQLTGTSQITQR